MTPWYEESFGHEYLTLYTHRNLEEARTNVRSIVELLSLNPDAPLLDLCCGAGRYLLALREQGFNRLVGLDLSNDLLSVAVDKLARTNGHNPIPLIQADMRAIPLENHFAAVLSLFTSFGYFQADRDNQAVLEAAHTSLKPGGIFLLDYLNRDHLIENLIPRDEKPLPDGRVHNVRCLTDQCRRVEKTTTYIKNGNKRQFRESVRLYSQPEMMRRFRAAGFVKVCSYGTFRGDEFTKDSRRLILVGKKEALNGRQN
jgi:ubiquinone/menaquinone biosynthesis C-methylase UbiE